MTAATRTNSSVSATVTQASLTTAIKTAMSNCGYSAPYDEVSGTTNNIIYQIVLDASKTKGTAYLKINITSSLGITQEILDNWTVASHSGTNSSGAGSTYSFSSSPQIDLVALSHPEAKLVLLIQGSSTIYLLGYIRPTNRPSWWDENNYLFAFCGAYLGGYFRGAASTSSPYGQSATSTESTSSSYTCTWDTRLSNANPLTTKRDILPGLVLFSPGNQGIAGRTSDDFVLLASSSTNILDVFQVTAGTEEYLRINNDSFGLGIRIV